MTDEIFVWNPDAVTRRVAGETVIVPVRNNVADLGSLYTLNETGTFVWERLDGSRSVGQVIEAITAAFEISREEAAQDVARLVEDLRTEGLVRAGPP